MVSFGETPEQYFALFALRQYASQASQVRFYCSRQEPYFYGDKGLVKKYRGGGGGGPEHLEMWLIKNT